MKLEQTLQQRTDSYILVLFTFQKPKGRDLIESAVGFAALSRFVIADLTEPKSLPTELQQIVTDLSFIANHQRDGTRICHVWKTSNAAPVR